MSAWSTFFVGVALGLRLSWAVLPVVNSRNHDREIEQCCGECASAPALCPRSLRAWPVCSPNRKMRSRIPESRTSDWSCARAGAGPAASFSCSSIMTLMRPCCIGIVAVVAAVVGYVVALVHDAGELRSIAERLPSGTSRCEQIAIPQGGPEDVSQIGSNFFIITSDDRSWMGLAGAAGTMRERIAAASRQLGGVYIMARDVRRRAERLGVVWCVVTRAALCVDVLAVCSAGAP